MTKDPFQLILGIVEETYQPISNRGIVPVSSQECVQMGLWYLGNKATYREIAELFGLSESAVFNAEQVFIRIICSVGNRYIKWPTHNEAKEIEQKFTNFLRAL